MIFEIWLVAIIIVAIYAIQTRILEGNYELRDTLHLNSVYRFLCIVFSPIHRPLDDSGDETHWSVDPYNITPHKRRAYDFQLRNRMRGMYSPSQPSAFGKY